MKHIGIVFPGQGSQAVGMLSDIATRFPEVENTFAEASSILGYDLWQLAQHGPEDTLNQTVYTQPALLAAGVAMFRIITKRSLPKPILLAGHSLGEYTALVCANAISFNDAISVVANRGQFMQDAVSADEGAMAAIIGLEDAAVLAICRELNTKTEIVAPANFNSIGQIVIAGHAVLVSRACELAKAQGAKMAVILPVSVPAHCELMRSAATRLAEVLATITIQLPTIPIINNISATQYQSVEEIRAGLIQQVFQPVRWVETIQCFVRAGIDTIIECGPGKVLTGLNKRIDNTVELMATTDLASLERIA